MYVGVECVCALITCTKECNRPFLNAERQALNVAFFKVAHTKQSNSGLLSSILLWNLLIMLLLT